MSDEPPKLYTGREIVLELFPATPDRLVPRPSAYALERDEEGGVAVRDRRGALLLRLAPVARANGPVQQLCCDLCHWSGPGTHLGFLRADVPGAQGRRWRYVCACYDTAACDARRLDDASVERLLARGD